jgi:hypothetical protein
MFMKLAPQASLLRKRTLQLSHQTPSGEVEIRHPRDHLRLPRERLARELLDHAIDLLHLESARVA